MADRWTWKAHARGKKPDPDAATVTVSEEGSDSYGRYLFSVEVDGLITAEELSSLAVEIVSRYGRRG